MPRVYRMLLVFCLCCWLPSVVYAATFPIKEGDKGQEILEVQTKLKERGYTVKALDGMYSPSNVKAIKAFQKSNKLEPTGLIDLKTYQLLVGKKANDVAAPAIAAPVAAIPVPNPTLTPTIPPSGTAVSRGSTQQIINTAMQYIGVPYKFGGNSPKGFDCSGFTQYVFSKNGISLPRTADVQFRTGKIVGKSELKQGDLVFFTTYEPGASHVGIYTENGRFIHASSSKGVMISRLDDVYWKGRYVGAKRMTFF